ncbi:PKD domain-containing protein [Micromonospora sp. NPDC004540]|uniref:PKD domain-containing protein n=1 Tax=Micromonospora sp. NPDC004540 TaxID=3154457 RepID=UPI0033A317D6
MVRRNAARLVVALVGVIALLATGQTAAFAAPANDDYSAAIAVEAVPFTTTIDSSGATTGPTDPTTCSNKGSVWFTVTPERDGRLQADTIGSDYDTVLSAWTGEPGAFTQLACNDDYQAQQSRVAFPVTAGTTYRFMIGVCCGNGGVGGGSLRFSISYVPPPPNDNFADATRVTGLPYSNTQPYEAASREAGETSVCASSQHTTWYSYTPTTTVSVVAQTNPMYAGINVYLGSSLGGLSFVRCTGLYDYRSLTFVAEAGRTYLFQVSGDGIASHAFQLTEAPDPVANFSYYRSDPNSFDLVAFSNTAHDPAGAGLESFAWDFGDGATSTEPNPVHRFPRDGDYPVRLTVETPDGRSDSITRVVEVRTHDVAIVRVKVPTSARAGQTVTVEVHVQNTRYEENVQVDLYKSIAGDYSHLGAVKQTVPVSETGRTSRFAFTYTVTADDLALGKLTFRAAADLSPNRDAIPADNELLSTPIKVI